MAPPDLSAQSANLLRAVGSKATCSAATVESLKLILLPSQHPTARSKTLPPSAPSSKPSRLGKVSGKVAGKPTTVRSLETTKNGDEDVKTQEKLVLATEVFNSTLKSMTDSAKTLVAQQTTRPRKRSLARASSGSSVSQETASRCATPLRQISSNCVLNPPVKGSLSRKPSSTIAQSHEGGLRAQAECARVAMAAHRYLLDQRPKKAEPTSLSLEAGMSALIAKFLALGYEDLALKELRILKRRIENIGISEDKGNCRHTGAKSTSYFEEESTESRVETASELLKFKTCNATGPFLAIIITTQLQVLRHLKSKANASRIQEALEHLRLNVSYSPVNLIQRQIDPKSVKSKERAAHQLESFSQTLLSIASDHSSGTGDVKDLKHLPQVVFELQTLALEVRKKWWSLVGHRIDTLKELLEPFARCLALFRRRSSVEGEQRYQKVVIAFNTITFGLESPTQHHVKSFCDIYLSLADLAQDCMRYGDATEWLEKATGSLASDDGLQAKRCALICREVALRIRSDQRYSNGHALVLHLERAVTCLEGGLHGTSDDLDEVLIAVTSLRKSTFKVIQDVYKMTATETPRPPADLVRSCVRVIILAMRFVNRYIGSRPKEKFHQRLLLRYNERRQLAYPIAKSFIESVVTITGNLTKMESVDFDTIDAGLRDSVLLASSLEDLTCHQSSSSIPIPTIHTVFISISNGYWYRFLQMRQDLGDTKPIRSILRTSIDLIKNRELSNQIAGALPSKLEAYAQLCERLQDPGTAFTTYKEALRIQTDSGLVQKFAEYATLRSLPVVIDGQSNLRYLARSLEGYVRVAQKIQDSQDGSLLYYDDYSLPSLERAILLEYQLHCMTLALQERSGSSQLCNAVCKMTKTTLSLLTAKESSIRRLRIVIQMLYLRAVFPASIEEPILLASLDEYGQQRLTQSFSSDLGLLKFVPHLVSSLEIFLAMREDKPDVEVFAKTFESWTELIMDCSDWVILQEHVYDLQEWLLHLELIVDYLAMQGLDVLKTSALHILAIIHETSKTRDCSHLVSKLCSLGVHYVRLGYCGAGGLVLQKAHLYLDTYKPTSWLTLRWYISYAEYALDSQNYDLCKEHVEKAERLLENDANAETSEKVRHKGQLESDRLGADLQYVKSQLAAAEGQRYDALLLARLCAKSYYRTWTILERRQDRCKSETSRSLELSANETLMASMSQLSLTEDRSATQVSSKYTSLQGASFWHLVPRLFQSLMYVSQCFSHNGLYIEALYYLVRSRKIAEAVRSSTMMSHILAIEAQYEFWYGNNSQSLELYKRAEKESHGNGQHVRFALLQTNMAVQFKKCGQKEAGDAAFASANKILDRLMKKSFLDGLIHKAIVADSLEATVSNLSLREDRSVPQRPTKARSTKFKQILKSNAQAKRLEPCYDDLPRVDVIPLCRMQGNLLREQSLSAMDSGCLDLAATLVDEASTEPCNPESAVVQALAVAKLHFLQGVQELMRHPIFNIIAESSICCPSLSHWGDHRRQPNLSSIPQEKARNASKKISRIKIATKTEKGKTAQSDDSECSLRRAENTIKEVFRLAQKVSSTVVLHDVASFLGKLLMMLAPLSLSAKTPVSTMFLIYTTEMGRMFSLMRGSWAVDVDRRLSDGNDARGPLSTGSIEEARLPEDNCKSDEIPYADFQAGYIDIIPKNWVVISMTMSESSEEIMISKIRAGKTPFVLKIPLNRQDSLDIQDEAFGFVQGKAELKNIIDLANRSTGDAGDLSRKGTKTIWWDTRNALDARLKDLLNNVESIWLGGFRGIFSQTQPNADLLARFERSLQIAFDKYLPSRQKAGKAKETSRDVLDSNVLDLFVGLGKPSENNEIDEPVTDLLYFVVDILQFNGERNAYDEIDFDSIAIETLDALRQYHQAFQNMVQSGPKLHTILILDKSLHCFPWESLNCMQGSSVSRLPSLSCLRDRILQRPARTHPTSSSADDFFVNTDDGFFVLNPGGDLKNTQAKFEEPLLELGSWNSIIEREPTEVEMKNGLENHEIFLYFGHGSGGQYIRQRTIRKLNKCAVALLMGCSSGAMTEAGAFESYGTPIDYMHAGCPAVLATLWDVTDKDIDRFSESVLKDWGLLKKEQQRTWSSPVKKPARQKGKGKMKEIANVEQMESQPQEPKSLDEAVAKGRDSCILKYLNGAAPVVYGIPVYLT